VTGSMKSDRLFVVSACAAWAALAGILQAQTEPIRGPAADAHTLLLAHYNTGFDADYAKGNAQALKCANPGGAVLAPGRFGQALSIPRGAFGIAYAVANNIRPAQGTVEFWLKGTFPDPDADDQRKYWLGFFHAGCDQTGLGIWRSQYNHFGFSIGEGYRGLTSLVFGNAGPGRVNDGAWHHVAATWDRDHCALFVDGRRKAFTEKPVYPSFDSWCAGALYVGYAPFDDYEYNASANREGYLPRSAQAAIDELRISDVVRYVADFVPPADEHPGGRGESGAAARPSPGEAGPRAGERDGGFTGASAPCLALDFDKGFDGQALTMGTNGQAGVRAVPAGVCGSVQLVDGRTGKAAYLHATTVPGDALYYPVAGLITPFLGAVECSLKGDWKADDGKRHIILDLRNRARTGYLLERTADGRVRFSSQESARILTEVALPAGALADGRWHALRAAWHTEGLKLFVDEALRAESREAVVPSVLGRHLFVGSSYEAVDQLDGAVDDVRIYRQRVRTGGQSDAPRGAESSPGESGTPGLGRN